MRSTLVTLVRGSRSLLLVDSEVTLRDLGFDICHSVRGSRLWKLWFECDRARDVSLYGLQ